MKMSAKIILRIKKRNYYLDSLQIERYKKERIIYKCS